MKGLRRLAAVAAACLTLGAAFAPARADTPYPNQRRLSDETLAGQRGGFLTAGGLTLDFGADMKTFVDGRLALETMLNWTDQGAVAREVGPGGGAGVVLPAGAAASATLTDPSGTIRLVQALSSQAFANVVLNTASNHLVTQATDITLTLPGFGATQQSYRQALVGMSLARQLGMALTRTH